MKNGDLIKLKSGSFLEHPHSDPAEFNFSGFLILREQNNAFLISQNGKELKIFFKGEIFTTNRCNATEISQS